MVILIVLFRPKGNSNLPFKSGDIIFISPENGGYMSICHNQNGIVYPVTTPTTFINQDFYWQIGSVNNSTFQIRNYHLIRDGEDSYLSNTDIGLILAKQEVGANFFSLEEDGLATGIYKIKSEKDNTYLTISNSMFLCSQNQVGLNDVTIASNFSFHITHPG